jgi:hypothetical protein
MKLHKPVMMTVRQSQIALGQRPPPTAQAATGITSARTLALPAVSHAAHMRPPTLWACFWSPSGTRRCFEAVREQGFED